MNEQDPTPDDLFLLFYSNIATRVVTTSMYFRTIWFNFHFFFQNFSLYQIFGHMHGALNINKN